MGKGSSPRPYSVSKAEYDRRFDEIFKKNKDKLEPPRDEKSKKSESDPDSSNKTK